MKGRIIRRIIILIVLVVATLSVHYGLFPHTFPLHLIHRRLCYIPILLSAIWFGVRGGVSTAVGISILLLPLILCRNCDSNVSEELIEIAFYIAFGFIGGWIVDRRELERKRKEDLEIRLLESEHLSSIGKMTAAIAHEVKTPLASIRGAAEILQDEIPPTSEKRTFVEILLKETERLRRVVEDFLLYSKPFSLKKSDFDYSNTLRDIVSQMQREADSKNVKIQLIDQYGNQTFSGDEERIRQVFQNLIKNAIEASPEGGTVKISISRIRDRLITRVIDEGSGIKDEIMEHLFEPFSTSKSSGTGLGLSISKQIVEAHGGIITADNLPKKGAEFRVEFFGEKS